MDKHSNDLAALRDIFSTRQRVYDEHTDIILKKISHITNALFNIFQLPHENVVWEDVLVEDGVLVVVATIFYRPDQISPYIATIAPPMDELSSDIEGVEQLIRVGIPLPLVFSSQESIEKFLIGIVKKTEDPAIEAPKVPTAFIDDYLTKEQREQLLLFQHTKSTIKH